MAALKTHWYDKTVEALQLNGKGKRTIIMCLSVTKHIFIRTGKGQAQQVRCCGVFDYPS